MTYSLIGVLILQLSAIHFNLYVIYYTLGFIGLSTSSFSGFRVDFVQLLGNKYVGLTVILGFL